MVLTRFNVPLQNIPKQPIILKQYDRVEAGEARLSRHLIIVYWPHAEEMAESEDVNLDKMMKSTTALKTKMKTKMKMDNDSDSDDW